MNGVAAVPDLARYSEIEALRDGHPVEIRALRPEDRDDFLAAVGDIGTDSLYRRFFAVNAQSTPWIHTLERPSVR